MRPGRVASLARVRVMGAMSGDRRSVTVLAVLIGSVLASWMLLMPPGAQPDEHSHIVRSAALVRAAEGTGTYTLPDRYRVPDPGCYAFDPRRPVTCAQPAHPDGVPAEMVTRADDYPPGAHLVFGLAGVLPGFEPVWWMRLAAVAVSTGLLAASIAASLRRGRLAAAAVLLAVTPMAWSIMSAVNPSAFAIAGAVALWVAAVVTGDRSRWLEAVGWASLAMSRRDGLVWAALILAIHLVADDVAFTDWVRRLGRRPAVLVAASTLVTIGWGVSSDSSTSRLVVLAPAAVAVAEAVRRVRALGRTARTGLAAGGIGATVIAWPILIGALRTGGWDTALFLRVVEQTDDNFVEAIGRLGWLDTPLPAFALFGWLLLSGMLVAVSGRTWLAASVVAALAVVTAWSFELLQGNQTGTYWQGRYSLPLLVGVPILLVRRIDVDARSARRIATVVAFGALLFVNVAAWAAARRFGVGVDGSHLPWRWDTPLQPVPPLALLGSLAASSLGLALTVAGRRNDHR
jgi:hypothetical protein